MREPLREAFRSLWGGELCERVNPCVNRSALVLAMSHDAARAHTPHTRARPAALLLSLKMQRKKQHPARDVVRAWARLREEVSHLPPKRITRPALMVT